MVGVLDYVVRTHLDGLELSYSGSFREEWRPVGELVPVVSLCMNMEWIDKSEQESSSLGVLIIPAKFTADIDNQDSNPLSPSFQTPSIQDRCQPCPDSCSAPAHQQRKHSKLLRSDMQSQYRYYNLVCNAVHLWRGKRTWR